MRIGFLGPAGTFSEQALLGEPSVPARRRAGPARDGAPGRRRGGRRRRRPRARADRELAGGLGERDARRARARRPGRADRRRARAAGLATACSPGPGWRSRTSASCSPIRRASRSARASCARRCPAAEVRAATSTAEAVREVAETDDAWAALGTPLAGELYGATTLARDLEDEPATRRASCGSRARATARRRGRPEDGGLEELDRVLGATATGRPAGSCAACPSSPSAASTSPGSSRGRRACGSVTTCSWSTSRAARTARRGRRRDRRAAAHCEEVRVLGSYPRAAGARTG